jgi:hypothetical protein
MNKLFYIAIIFTSFSFADLDIGEDFEPGDLVSAEEFNLKFGKLKKVVGEIKDEEILGSWDCTRYELTQDTDNSWYFESKTGRLIFSDTDSNASLDSPKDWIIDTADILHLDGFLEGSYVLLLNKLHLFINSGLDEDEHPSGLIGTYAITFTNDSKMILDSGEWIGDRLIPMPNILCENVE